MKARISAGRSSERRIAEGCTVAMTKGPSSDAKNCPRGRAASKVAAWRNTRAPGRRGVGHHQHATHVEGTPPALTSQERWHDAALAIQLGVEILHVGQRALDLDDEQGPRLGVPAHDVDAAPIAVVIGVLHEHVPVVLAEETDHGLDQARVFLIE